MRAVCLSVLLSSAVVSAAIHVNQAGYYPAAKKIAVVVDTTATSFQLLNSSTGEVVFTGALSEPLYYDASREKTVLADFTGFRSSGSYALAVPGHGTSYTFDISESRFDHVLKQMVRSYYFQRCSYELLPQYAGEYEREAGHPDLGLPVLDTDLANRLSYDVPGGWYDAGDYGKYVVNAGITCASLLGLFELCPDIIGDDLDIPESGNNISDLLDEVKYELDWLLTMQDEDGGVLFKVGSDEWSWDVMPAHDDKDRYVIGKSTTSTLNFAAVLAMAARIYEDYDATFAQECGDRAEAAWQWACENPQVLRPMHEGGTGPYGDGDDLQFKDEFFWAASELYLSTAKSVYRDTLLTMLQSRTITGAAWWQDVNNLGYFSLSVHQNDLGDAVNNAIESAIIAMADTFVNRIGRSAYRISMESGDYLWGSSGTIGNHGALLVYAHFLTGEQRYLDALVMTTDYLFGKNPMGKSYVTGIGSESPRFPHARIFKADGIDDPIPGFVVGGANQRNEPGIDPDLREVILSGAPPAKCYIDSDGSWASNEVAINQNAPWVLILGYLETHQAENNAAKAKLKGVRTVSREQSFRIKREAGAISISRNAISSPAKLKIYTLQGKCIASKDIKPGESTIRIKVNSLGSESIVICLQRDGSTIAQKMTLVR